MIFIVNLITTALWMALIWGFDEYSEIKKSKNTFTDYHEAVPVYRGALAVDPGNRVLNKRIAHCYFYGSRFRESLNHIERLVRADPRNPYCHCLRGAALVLSGDGDGGRKTIARWRKRLSRGQRETLKRNMTRLIRDIGKREEIRDVLGMRQVWVRYPVKEIAGR